MTVERVLLVPCRQKFFENLIFLLRATPEGRANKYQMKLRISRNKMAALGNI